jgi:hypothetical protein
MLEMTAPLPAIRTNNAHGQESCGRTDLIEASPRSRGVLPGQHVSGRMRSRAGRRGYAQRNEERKSHLPQIVGFPGVTAKQIAQRPLQEQQRNQGQCEPFGGSDSVADQAIEAAQEDRQMAVPLISFRTRSPATQCKIASVSRQIPCPRGICDLGLPASIRDQRPLHPNRF